MKPPIPNCFMKSFTTFNQILQNIQPVFVFPCAEIQTSGSNFPVLKSLNQQSGDFQVLGPSCEPNSQLPECRNPIPQTSSLSLGINGKWFYKKGSEGVEVVGTIDSLPPNSLVKACMKGNPDEPINPNLKPVDDFCSKRNFDKSLSDSWVPIASVLTPYRNVFKFQDDENLCTHNVFYDVRWIQSHASSKTLQRYAKFSDEKYGRRTARMLGISDHHALKFNQLCNNTDFVTGFVGKYDDNRRKRTIAITAPDPQLAEFIYSSIPSDVDKYGPELPLKVKHLKLLIAFHVYGTTTVGRFQFAILPGADGSSTQTRPWYTTWIWNNVEYRQIFPSIVQRFSTCTSVANCQTMTELFVKDPDLFDIQARTVWKLYSNTQMPSRYIVNVDFESYCVTETDDGIIKLSLDISDESFLSPLPPDIFEDIVPLPDDTFEDIDLGSDLLLKPPM